MKRAFLSGVFAFVLLAVSPAAEKSFSPVDYVNPFIGTTNFGTTHPGAVCPNGMMSVVPFNVMGSADNKYDKDILPKSLRNLDEDSIMKMIKDYNGNESPKVGVDNVENSKKEGFNDYNNNIIIQENYSKIKNDDELQKKGKRSGNGRKKGKRFK